MKNIGNVILAMTDYFGGDVRRINHFLKVYSFAKTIGENEGLDSNVQEILEVAAVVHDIGIKLSEEKYNSSAGKYQEIEGVGEAEKLLNNLGYDKDFIERVCYLVGHHHTYNSINGLDYQILIEADFLVNIFEDNLDKKSVKNLYDKIFITDTGKRLVNSLYDKC